MMTTMMVAGGCRKGRGKLLQQQAPSFH